MLLAEIFNIELKFIIDTVKSWFNEIIKKRFSEVDYSAKYDFRKKKIQSLMKLRVQSVIFC